MIALDFSKFFPPDQQKFFVIGNANQAINFRVCSSILPKGSWAEVRAGEDHTSRFSFVWKLSLKYSILYFLHDFQATIELMMVVGQSGGEAEASLFKQGTEPTNVGSAIQGWAQPSPKRAQMSLLH